jgi:hypothetical protein
MRDGAGHDVPLAMFGTPQNPDYWRAADELGFGQLVLLLPTLPTDESLRLLDDYAELVAQYRGSRAGGVAPVGRESRRGTCRSCSASRRIGPRRDRSNRG